MTTPLDPIVRIAMWALAGWLAGKGADPELVEMIRLDPVLVAGVIAGINSVWYGIAKWRGWNT